MADFWDADPPPASSPAPSPHDDFWEATVPDPGRSVSGYTAVGGKATWSDVPHAVAAGAHTLAADFGGLGAAMARTPEQAVWWSEGAQGQQRAALESEQAMTPYSQEPGFFRHPLVSTAEAAPGIAAIGAPALAAGPFAPLVVGATMAGQSAGQVYNEMMQQAMDAGMSREDADRAIRASGALPVAAGIGAGVGAATELTGGLAKPVSNIVKRALLGTAGDTITFGVQSGAQEAVAQHGEQKMGTREGYDTGAIGEATISGAEQGVAFSPFHLLHPAEPRGPKPPTETRTPATAPSEPATPRTMSPDLFAPKQIDRHQDQTPGKATVTRGGKGDLRKPEAQTTTGGKAPATPTEKPPVEQVGPTTLDANTGAALKGEPIAGGEAPPAPTPEVTPRVTPEPAPAPSPTPAAEAPPPAPAAPAGDPTARAQHAELIDPNHPREAMAYPEGHAPLPTPGDRYAATKLPDGRVAQYDRQGASNLTYQKLHALARAGKADELLSTGSIKREEAPPVTPRVTPEEPKGPPPERAVAGEAPAPAERPPVAPAEPAEAGVAPAPEPAPAPQPAGETGAEKFERLERLKQEMNARVAAEHAARQEAGRGQAATEAAAQPRVLEDVSQAGVKALQASERAAREREKQLAKEAAAEQKRKEKAEREAQGPQAGHDVKRVEARQANNAIADKIAAEEKHAPRADDANHPTQVYARAKSMVEAARKAGFKFNDTIKDTVDPEHAHSNASVLLHEARDLIRTKLPKRAQYEMFRGREYMLREHGEEGKKYVLEQRREMGKEGGKVVAPPKEEGAGEITGEETPELKEREDEQVGRAKEDEEGRADLHEEEAPPAQAPEAREEEAAPKTREEVEAEQRAEFERRMAERRAESERLHKEGVTPRVTAPVAGFQREVKPKRTFTRKLASEEGPEITHEEMEELESKWAKEEEDYRVLDERLGDHATPKKLLNADIYGNPIELSSYRTELARNLLKLFDPTHYDKELRPMVEALVKRVSEIAGHVKVEFIDNDDTNAVFARKPNGGRTFGFYDSDRDRIFLNRDFIHERPDTLFHEAFHAATTHAIREQPELKELIHRLRKEVNEQIPSPDIVFKAGGFTAREIGQIRYAFSNADEFLTGLMTNPVVQRFLKTVKISDELAKDIGIPKWRKATGFNGVVHTILRAFGMTPRHASAIEAALALTEQATWRRDPGAGMAYAARMAKLPSREMARENVEEAKEAGGKMDQLAEKLPYAIRDALPNLWRGARDLAPKIMEMAQVADVYAKPFTDKAGNIIRDLGRVFTSRAAMRDALNKADTKFIADTTALMKANPQHADNFDKLLAMSSNFNIDARKPPIDKPLAKQTLAEVQQHANWKEAHELLNSMPKELRDHYGERAELMRDKGKAMGMERINTILDHAELPSGVTRDEMFRRIRDNDMTGDDEEHYGKLHLSQEIADARMLMKGDRMYFPSYRDGNFVVTGRYAMPAGGMENDIAGKKLDDNVRQFNDELAAKRYAAATPLHAHIEKILYDPNTGKRVSAKEASTEEMKTKPFVERYQVTLQREHTEFHPSHMQAKRAIDDMKAAGVEDISGVLNRRNDRDWAKLSSGSTRVIERGIDDREDLTTKQKSAMKDTLRQNMLIQRTALQGHLIRRRFVAGGDYGSVDALRSYTEAVNHYLATKHFEPQLDAVMKRLETQDDKNRTTKYAEDSSAVANEMRERAYAKPNTPPAILRKLQALGYVRYLAGPRHMAMQLSHLPVFGATQMAGRHGYIPSVRAMMKAAADTGGMMEGLKVGGKATLDNARSMLTKDAKLEAKLARTPDLTGDMIARIKEGNRRDAAEQLAASNHVHGGFGDDFYGSTGLSKVDAMLRQINSALDAQTRLIQGLSAYDLEFKKTGDHAKAIEYARQKIEGMLGVHTPEGTPSALRNPVARAAMQFKQLPARLVFGLARNVYKAFKDEDKEVRREAVRTLGYQLGMATSLGGLHGLPLGLLKPLGILASALNITPSPDQMDDKLHRWLAETIGPTAANMLMDGVLAAFPHAPNLHNMVSYDFDMLFGEPRNNDFKHYLLDAIGGASASVAGDMLTGVRDVVTGKWGDAVDKIPFRPVGDLHKAWKWGTEGMVTPQGYQLTPGSYEDAAWQALGFGTQGQARAQAGATALKDALQAQRDKAKEERGAKGAAMKKPKETILGAPVTPKSKSLLREYQQVYQ